MNAKQALLTVLIWSVVFAILGGAVGGFLGSVVPSYYRMVFRAGESPSFDPFSVGIGLGVTQGLTAGVAISIIVLAIQAWRDRKVGLADDKTDSGSSASAWSMPAIWTVITALTLLVAVSIAFVAGAITGEQQLYQRLTDDKLEKIAHIVESEKYPNIDADFSSAAQVYLVGTVATESAFESLKTAVVQAVGTKEADSMLRLVEVAND